MPPSQQAMHEPGRLRLGLLRDRRRGSARLGSSLGTETFATRKAREACYLTWALGSRNLWMYAGLGLAAGVGLVVVSTPAKAQNIFLHPGTRILLFGDSLAQGLAPPLSKLAQEAGYPFQADGRTGTRIQDWATQAWLVQDLKAQPTLVLVSLGTNDMRMPDPSVEKPALLALVQKLKSFQVVLIAPPTMPFPDKGVRKMLTDTGLPLFHSETLQIPRASDGIHPTALGYAGWAGVLWKRLGPTAAFAGLKYKAPEQAPMIRNLTDRGIYLRKKVR